MLLINSNKSSGFVENPYSLNEQLFIQQNLPKPFKMVEDYFSIQEEQSSSLAV